MVLDSRPSSASPQALSPGQLTSLIKDASSIADLEQLEQQHGAAFSFIHTSAAFNTAAKVVRRPDPQQQQRLHRLFARLWQRLQTQLDACGTQALSIMFWSCSKVGYTDAALLNTCLARMVRMADGAAPQHLSNCVYGAALLCQARAQYRADEQQLLQLVAALVDKRSEAWPQALSNTLWAAAVLQLPVPEQQAHQLVAELVRRSGEAKAQDVAITLWAAATLQLHIPEQQAQRLVEVAVERRHAGKAQDVSNTLWAAATMQLRLPGWQAQQLVTAAVERRQEAKPQELSNIMWAAATMQLSLPFSTWRLLLEAFEQKVRAANPQEVSSTLWAAAKGCPDQPLADEQAAVLLRLAEAVRQEQVAQMSPQAVSNSLWALSELYLKPPALVGWLARAAKQRAGEMRPQEVCNTATALAKLALQDEELLAALVSRAQQEQQHFTSHDLCSLCQALVVAQQQQLAEGVVEMCRRVGQSRQWDSVSSEDLLQLYHVHLVLQDWRLDGGAGLAGALSAGQLQQCKALWDARQRERPALRRRTAFEQQVFGCAERLQGLRDCKQEGCTADGAFNVDVVATHDVSGKWLAIEADGPTHFLHPDKRPTGQTLARNRALAARGFVVVCVPWFDWWGMWEDEAAQAAYLSRRVEEEVGRAA